MKRIDLILNSIERLDKGQGVTTIEISKTLNLERSNVSKDLNKLVSLGKLYKNSSRPVKYFLNSPTVINFSARSSIDNLAYLYPSLAPAIKLAKTKLYKNSSRPVKYFLNSPTVINFSARSSIDNLAYLYPSLAPAIKLAKTSIIYPPNGMNSLIIGDTGVGKSMLAKLMYEYAQSLSPSEDMPFVHFNSIIYPPNGMNSLIIGDTGVGKSMLAKLMYEYAQSLSPSEDMPFVHFNCSDYSNNPQLLSAHLFGVKKGTFTGATEDRPGLIEQADGGFLFLDEIHNLPNEGQEMLFVYMDTGYFKRFGEVSKQLKSTTRIICATNKDINSSLLDTFTRRIPIKINLPGLNERLLEERLTLIEYFLKEESLKLDKPILVSYNAMLCLLSYHCQYNIGQLKNDITLVVANAFSDYFINNKKQLKINSPDLPELIKSMSNSPLMKEKELLNSLNFDHGYITYDASTEITSHSYVKQRHVILGGFTNLIKNIDNIVINKDTPRETINNLFQGYLKTIKDNEANYRFSLDDYATNLIKNIDNIVINKDTPRETINNLFQGYLKTIKDNEANYRFSLDDYAFNEFVEEASASNNSIKIAFENGTIKNFFRVHIDLIYDRINLINFNPLPVLNRLKSYFNEEYDLAFDITSVIEKTYNINISSVEVLFLVLFCIYINQ